MFSGELGGTCVEIPPYLFGMPIASAIMVILGCAMVLGLLLYLGYRFSNQLAKVFAGFRASALFLAVAAYALLGVALYYAWMYENPAELQSEELLSKMSYASSNSSNSSYQINLSGVAPQMTRFVQAGLKLLVVVVGASFFCVAASTLHWDKCRLLRAIGLIPLAFVPLAGLATFMTQSNWLKVVYMGTYSCSIACTPLVSH